LLTYEHVSTIELYVLVRNGWLAITPAGRDVLRKESEER
jgi:hypothetical protein